MALSIALVCVSVPTQAERVTLEDRRTTFQHLTVIEDTTRRERYLYSDDERYLQAQISLRRPDDLAPAYLRSALLGLVFAPANPSSMLFVGLGAGSLTDLSLDLKTMRQRIQQLKIRHRIDVDLAALAALAVPWETIPAKGRELRDEPHR